MALMITGGTGFIGAYITRYVAEHRPGEKIVVVDRYPAPDRIAGLEDVVEIHDTDISQTTELIDLMQRHDVDRVIHLAFAIGATRPDRILQYVQSQGVGSVGLFEAARIAGVRRVIAASSVAVFGGRQSDRPLGEDDPVTPSDLYGATKAWMENVANLYIDLHGLEIAHLRISASMGIGRLGRASLRAGLTTERLNWMAAPEFAAIGQPVTLPPREQVIDFIYAVDTAAAFYQAAYAEKLGHRIYNLTGEHHTAGELGDAIRKALPDAQVTHDDAPTRKMSSMSNDRIRDDLKFRPAFSLEEGVREYIRAAQALHGINR